VKRPHDIRGRDDKGGISILLAIGLTAILMIIGLSVDGGGVMRESHRADDIAAEAARAGGQEINIQQAIGGNPLVLDPVAVSIAVQQYLANAGANGSVTIATDRAHLTVTVTLVYRTVMLGFMGINTYTVTGTATAALVAA
jgi:Flp pilus assembly protein TadG